jgi:hypothetical protein
MVLERNLCTVHRSFIGSSEACGTNRNVNLVLITNVNLDININIM